MTNLEIIKSEHGWKIISNTNTKHPALVYIAKLLNEHKAEEPHIGLYNVYGGLFRPRITVYSYRSGKTEKQNKKQYNKWRRGKRQLYVPKKKQWKPEETEDLIESLSI